MGKKKRQRKTVVRFIYEGKREGIFLKYLIELYSSSAQGIEPHSGKGGTANSLISNAINASHVYQHVFVLLDEDFKQKVPISDETRDNLEKEWGISKGTLKNSKYREYHSKNVNNKNPIVIFSNPHSIEGILLQMLNVPKKDMENSNTDRLKDRLNSYCHANFDNAFLKEHFPKAVIENKRTVIPELDLIISLMEKAKKS